MIYSASIIAPTYELEITQIVDFVNPTFWLW